MKISRIFTTLGPGLTAFIGTALVTAATVGFTLMGISSCEREIVRKPSEPVKPQPDPSLTVLDGHLVFDTQEDFDRLFPLASEEEGGASKASGLILPEGFTPISERMRELESRATLQEGSAEGLKIARCQDLLNDGRLTHILDTTMIIEVGERIFKITDEGTWSTLSGNRKNFDRMIASADRSALKVIAKNETMKVGPDLLLTNTFGDKGEDRDFVIDESEEASKAYTTPSNNLHNGYNTVKYSWAAQTTGDRIAEFLGYKDYTRTADFDAKHRVSVRLFDNNYFFVVVAGISVKVEEQKSFIGIKYWTDMKNSIPLALGMNYLYIRHQHYTNPIGYIELSPASLGNGMYGFDRTIGSAPRTGYLYGRKQTASNASSDWGRYFTVCTPKLGMSTPTLITKQTNNILVALSQDNCFAGIIEAVKTAAQSMGAPKDPAMFILPEATSSNNEKFSITRTYITGLRQFNSNYREILFFSTNFAPIGGISLNGANVGFAMLNKSINMIGIEKIDAFGAACYNGQWKGIRFVL